MIIRTVRHLTRRRVLVLLSSIVQVKAAKYVRRHGRKVPGNRLWRSLSWTAWRRRPRNRVPHQVEAVAHA